MDCPANATFKGRKSGIQKLKMCTKDTKDLLGKKFRFSLIDYVHGSYVLSMEHSSVFMGLFLFPDRRHYNIYVISKGAIVVVIVCKLDL
jgi:hypothetical protein